MTPPLEHQGERELLPCPFCGGEALGFFDSECISVECIDCNCHTGSRDTVAEAIAIWNRRPAPAQPSQGERERLDAALEKAYPKTDSEHTSLQMLNEVERNAFAKGYRAALAQAPRLTDAEKTGDTE